MILIALQDQEASNWQNIICRIVPVVHSTHVQRYRYQVHNINTNMQLSTWEIIEDIWIDTEKELLRTGIMAWQMENGIFLAEKLEIKCLYYLVFITLHTTTASWRSSFEGNFVLTVLSVIEYPLLIRGAQNYLLELKQFWSFY